MYMSARMVSKRIHSSIAVCSGARLQLHDSLSKLAPVCDIDIDLARAALRLCELPRLRMTWRSAQRQSRETRAGKG